MREGERKSESCALYSSHPNVPEQSNVYSLQVLKNLNFSCYNPHGS